MVIVIANHKYQVGLRKSHHILQNENPSANLYNITSRPCERCLIVSSSTNLNVYSQTGLTRGIISINNDAAHMNKISYCVIAEYKLFPFSILGKSITCEVIK